MKSLLLLLFLVTLAYGNSLLNKFTMDDDFIIVDNPMIRNLEGIPRLFLTDYWAREGAKDYLVASVTGLYRPLVLSSYALNYQITELDPWSYHLVNLILHGLCTWLLYLLALGIGIMWPGALVAAAIFALHPIHTEAVTGIVGRAELLMTLGMLGALWSAMLGKPWWSLALFLAGLLSKEQAVMLPAVLVFYHLCGEQRGFPRPARPPGRGPTDPLFSNADLLRYGSYVMVLGGYLVLRWIALSTLVPPRPAFIDNPLAYAGAAERILTAFKIAGYYLWLCVWPASLSSDYSFNAIPLSSSIFEPGVLAGTLAWGSLTGWMVYSYVRGDRRIAFGIGLAMLTFLPVSNLIAPIGTIMGERLFYLPSAGLCLLVGWYLDFLVSRSVARRMSYILCLAVTLICLGLLTRTMVRNRDWKDNYTLFQSAGQVVPSSAKTRAYQGRVAQAEREWQRAYGHYQAALQIYPAYVDTDAAINVNLGDVYFKLGQLEKAVEALERGIRLAPTSPEAHYNLGLAYARLGRYQEAEPLVRKARGLRQDFPEAHSTLSRLLVEAGRYQEAVTEADAALALRPEFPDALNNRALALRALGRYSEADEAFRRAQGQ